MNKNKILAVLCLLSAIILGITSSMVTGKLFISFDNTWFGYILIAVGACIDFGKFAFPAVSAFSFLSEKYFSCIVYGLLSICCIIVSFSASMAYDFNQANDITNTAITGSEQYKRQASLFETTSNSVTATKKDIETSKANRQKAESQIRADYATRIANAKKLNYLTTPRIGVNDLSAARDEKIRNLDEAIAKKESNLSQKESDLSNVNGGFAGVTSGIKTTRGVLSLAQWFNKDDPEKALGQINFAKNILIEIIAIAFSIGFGILINKKEDGVEFESNDKPKWYQKIGFNQKTPQQITAKSDYIDEPKQKIIGFQAPNLENTSVVKSPNLHTASELHANFNLNKNDIMRYLEYMFEKEKNNVSPGFRTISKNIDMHEELARKVKGFLETIQIIESVGAKTVILCTKSEAVHRI